MEELSPSRRRGAALCLSGGGYRAALFHLGVLRRLHETGALSRIDTVSAVSGGSIVAAHLATRLVAAGRIRDWDDDIARPFHDLTAKNLRTAPLLTALLSRRRSVERLADRYHDLLTPIDVDELPARPRFIFCSTDLGGACNWVFERSRVGDWRVGYMRPAPRGLRLADAVAASSCFPPLFQPWKPRFDAALFESRGGGAAAEQRRMLQRLRLTDGGVYDNLALEPVWKNHREVLVSDGGALLPIGRVGGGITRLLRYAAVTEHQARSLRKRWLIASYVSGSLEGAYWGISTHDASDPADGYPAELVARIACIRTDLDAFSTGEQRILENHGYLTAARAVPHETPVRVPFPVWMDPERASDTLRGSDKRTLLGRR